MNGAEVNLMQVVVVVVNVGRESSSHSQTICQ